MIIDDHILEVLQLLVKQEGNTYRLSLKLDGIRHTTIRDWLSGKVKSISDKNWEKIEPLISDYMDDHDIAFDLEENPEFIGEYSYFPLNPEYEEDRDAMYKVESFITLIKDLSIRERAFLSRCLRHVKAEKQKYEKEVEFTFEAYRRIDCD